MTKPEQLAKWREDAKAAAIAWWNADHTLVFTHSVPNGYEAGYLRAKQETEQIMKLAKFGAMVIRDPSNGSIDKREILQYAILADVTLPNIEATIKELLND